MRVGIIGAGSIAFATAALLEQLGPQSRLWSPSGNRTRQLELGEPLVATGAIVGQFHPSIAVGARDLADNAEVLFVALPAYGHKAVLDQIAPYIQDTQTIIFSSHASFGAVYLSQLLSEQGKSPLIVAWGTTVVSSRQLSLTEVSVSTIRKQIDIATIPTARSAEGLEICRKLFGDRFVDRGSLLAIALSNLNPQNHMGIALGNMTRMERGETWSQGQNVTPNIGRLLEELDRERIAIAEALGLRVRTIYEHFHLSFHVPVGTISEMNQTMHTAGNGGSGPTTADSRYVLEDVPFGLVMTAKLGRLAGRPAKLHEAGVEIFSAMYGRNFAVENDLLNALRVDDMTLEKLRELCVGQQPASLASNAISR